MLHDNLVWVSRILICITFISYIYNFKDMDLMKYLFYFMRIADYIVRE